MFGIGACGQHPGASKECGPGAQSHQMGGPGHCIGSLLKPLNLTDDQLERIAALKGEGCAQFAQLKVDCMQSIKRLIKELLGDQIDKAKVAEIVEEAKSRKFAFIDQASARIVTLAETLTPQQRKQLRLGLIKKFLGLGFED